MYIGLEMNTHKITKKFYLFFFNIYLLIVYSFILFSSHFLAHWPNLMWFAIQKKYKKRK